MIYRETQRTEQFNAKQLNQPSFVSSVERNGYVFFFFREIAAENCGKTIYSRVARICKNDKGGPPPFRERWTSYLKTRLNCSTPGDFPFYFDELRAYPHFSTIFRPFVFIYSRSIHHFTIWPVFCFLLLFRVRFAQAEGTTAIMEGLYQEYLNGQSKATDHNSTSKESADAKLVPGSIIYAVFTTPQNAIPGSSVCAFRMDDIIESFEGKCEAQRHFALRCSAHN